MDLLTRADFDGLACATLLRDVGAIGNLKFVHPKDLQSGLITVTPNDILANVPYVEGCGMWFDHHTSEFERLGQPQGFVGSIRRLDSAAHVVYDYYKDQHNLSKFDEMLAAVDRVDSGKLTAEEILEPYGWVLLGFMMDPRTGLGRFRNFRISNYQLMEQLIEYCRVLRIDEILEQPDVKERIDLYRAQREPFRQMLKANTKVHGSVIVTDLRGMETIHVGNRFYIYTLYPECNISLWVVDVKNQPSTSIAVGYSILNRTATADIGSILLGYGGGGHRQVGTCQIPNEEVDRVLGELIGKLQ
jgi:nanoRNase/pAp phosphatase (c-di-AMP/oligoRNAs hydrolase)